MSRVTRRLRSRESIFLVAETVSSIVIVSNGDTSPGYFAHGAKQLRRSFDFIGDVVRALLRAIISDRGVYDNSMKMTSFSGYSSYDQSIVIMIRS